MASRFRDVATISRRTKMHISGSGSLRTTIPQIVGEMLALTKKDEVQWTVDTASGRVTITKADPKPPTEPKEGKRHREVKR
jgi:hypothetical protein